MQSVYLIIKRDLLVLVLFVIGSHLNVQAIRSGLNGTIFLLYIRMVIIVRHTHAVRRICPVPTHIPPYAKRLKPSENGHFRVKSAPNQH